jgi:putative hydrolase of the HAD superfamily
VGRIGETRRKLPEVVLFDMDDTIFDHALTCRAAIGRVRRGEPLLRTVPLDDLWRFYSRLLEETHPDVLRGRTSAAAARDARWLRLAAHLGGRQTLREARELSRRYRREYLALRRPVPGSIDLLRRLHRETTVAIVTNNGVAEQERTLRFLNIAGAVDLVIASAEIGVEKPDPRIFRAVLRRAGVEAREAVMIGDSWCNDVLGALRVGIRPIWFNRFHLPRPPGPTVDETDSFRPSRRIERLLAAAPDARPSPGPARIISQGPVQRP